MYVPIASWPAKSKASGKAPIGFSSPRTMFFSVMLGMSLTSQIVVRSVKRWPATIGSPGCHSYCMWCGSLSTPNGGGTWTKLTTLP
jgi:hypothetical protein